MEFENITSIGAVGELRGKDLSQCTLEELQQIQTFYETKINELISQNEVNGALLLANARAVSVLKNNSSVNLDGLKHDIANNARLRHGDMKAICALKSKKYDVDKEINRRKSANAKSLKLADRN